MPCKMGDAHGIYNSSGKTLKWLNFGVSTIKGRGDNFDLNDTRVGAKLDPIPQFVSGQLKRESLKPNRNAYTGNGILYRRIFGPDVFLPHGIMLIMLSYQQAVLLKDNWKELKKSIMLSKVREQLL